MVTDHAVQRAHQRTIKIRELTRSAQIGFFRYLGHGVNTSTGELKVKIQWLDDTTNTLHVAVFAQSSDLTCVTLVTLWRDGNEVQ